MKILIFLPNICPVNFQDHLKRKDYAKEDCTIFCDSYNDRLLYTEHYIILGDFDSYNPKTNKQQDKILHLPDQSKTDLEKALLFACQTPASDVHIFSPTQGRMDHMLYHFYLLYVFNSHFRLYLHTEQETWWIANQVPVQLNQLAQKRISLFAPFGAVKNLSTQGFAYPLNKATLRFEHFNSISNQIIADQAHIDFQSGDLLISLEGFFDKL